jgi:hypothetical protein
LPSVLLPFRFTMTSCSGRLFDRPFRKILTPLPKA